MSQPKSSNFLGSIASCMPCGKSQTTPDESLSIPLSQQGGLSQPNPTDEDMFQHWPEPRQGTENSRIPQSIIPSPLPSSARVPESRLSSARTSRIARQTSKSFSPVAIGSGTSNAPTTTQAQPRIDAERSSSVGSNTESITVHLSPEWVADLSVESRTLDRAGGPLETASTQRSG